jgi:hypothetical protein
MDSGQDLVILLREQRIELIDLVKLLKKLGRNLAEADFKYRVGFRKEVFRLHEEDSVGWSTCADLARGDAIVGKLRYDREVCASDYDCCKEKINQVKFEMRILEAEIKREIGG